MLVLALCAGLFVPASAAAVTRTISLYGGHYIKCANESYSAWYGKISPWAIEEIGAAIGEDLVPETMLERDYYLGSITRGETAQVIINLIEQTSGWPIDEFLKVVGASINNNAFTDTSDKAVLAANALDIIKGVGNNRFDPWGILTRAQFAAIINRVANVMGVNTAGFSHAFTDVKGHWADSELGWPVQAGIIKGVGDNKFDPSGNLTTEQTLAMTYRSLMKFRESVLNPSLPDSAGASSAKDVAAEKYDTIIDLYRDILRYGSDDAGDLAETISRNIAYELNIQNNEQKLYELECSIFEAYNYGNCKMGYALHDINSDGVFELIILSEDYYDIYAIYTLRGGKPALVGAYWSRNRCAIDKNGTVYINGSSGASDSFSASYSLDSASGELKLIKDLDKPYPVYPENPTKDAGLVYVGIYGRAD